MRPRAEHPGSQDHGPPAVGDRRNGTDALSVAVPMSRLDGPREDFIIETLLSVKARLALVRENSILR